jgi:hypothetical protein
MLNLIAHAQPKLCNNMTQTVQLHDPNDAIYTAISLFSTNQIAGNLCDYKMNILKIQINNRMKILKIQY